MRSKLILDRMLAIKAIGLFEQDTTYPSLFNLRGTKYLLWIDYLDDCNWFENFYGFFQKMRYHDAHYQITFEEFLNAVPPKIQEDLLFHLELFL